MISNDEILTRASFDGTSTGTYKSNRIESYIRRHTPGRHSHRGATIRESVLCTQRGPP